MLDQCLEVLSDRNAILDLNGMVIILTILRVLLTIGKYEHPTKQVKPCCQNRLMESIKNIRNL